MTTNKPTVNVQSEYQGIKFSDADVVNPDDSIASGEYNPHNVRPWLLHDHGFVVAVVFASCLQDALDEAADAGKLDHYWIKPDDASQRDDYMVKDVVTPGHDPECPDYVDAEGGKWWWQEGIEPTFLGNASEPFDIESLGAIELPNPARSWCAVFNASKP